MTSSTLPQTSNAIVNDPVVFDCIATDGIGILEGPYPAFDLPHIRWGLGPRTILRFELTSESNPAPVQLRILARRNDDPHQGMHILLNGVEICRHTFGRSAGFHDLRLPLEPRNGTNDLIIEYQSWGTRAEPRPIAVLFREIALRPASA